MAGRFNRSLVSRGRRTKSNRQLIWISDITTTTQQDSGSSFVVALPGDWERTASSGETASIIRVVGYLNIVRNATAAVVATERLAAWLHTADEDQVPLANVANVTNIGQAEDEKIMFAWQGLARTDTTTIGNFHPQTSFQIPFDIKVRRKITTGMDLEWSFGHLLIGGTSMSWRFETFTRTLIAVR